jgi:hypothetical protein
MIDLNDISWHTFALQSDVHDLEAHNGMPMEVMMSIMSQWTFQNTVLKVFDVKFKDGHPNCFRTVGFTDHNYKSEEDFQEFMFDVSLTHKVMFVDKYGGIFITESENGQTNIDADLIEGMLNAYR